MRKNLVANTVCFLSIAGASLLAVPTMAQTSPSGSESAPAGSTLAPTNPGSADAGTTNGGQSLDRVPGATMGQSAQPTDLPQPATTGAEASRQLQPNNSDLNRPGMPGGMTGERSQNSQQSPQQSPQTAPISPSGKPSVSSDDPRPETEATSPGSSTTPADGSSIQRTRGSEQTAPDSQRANPSSVTPATGGSTTEGSTTIERTRTSVEERRSTPSVSPASGSYQNTPSGTSSPSSSTGYSTEGQAVQGLW